MRLLLIEDDDLLGEGLRDFLRAEGHLVDWARGLDEARPFAASPMTPGWWTGSCRTARACSGCATSVCATRTTPALLLTARDRLADRVLGLDSGADDYLVKPFAPEELVARLRAVCRRSARTGQSRITLGEVEIDLAAHGAWRRGVAVELTAREWALLQALLLRTGRVVPRADLDRLVLGSDADVTSNAIEVHLSSLRRKLGRGLIETVRGLGYRLVDERP
jgi:two-component system OmpR family response regulator